MAHMINKNIQIKIKNRKTEIILKDEIPGLSEHIVQGF